MSHISFSGLKLWNECPYKYKLAYIDKVAKFEGNIYTAFGSAMHTVCEKPLLKEWKQEESPKNFTNSLNFVYVCDTIIVQKGEKL